MKEITPPHLRCMAGGCPAVYDVTPEHLKCTFGASCPSVSKIGDGRQLLIIGKVPSLEQLGDARVGPGELAIVIAAEYFSELNNAPKT